MFCLSSHSNIKKIEVFNLLLYLLVITLNILVVPILSLIMSQKIFLELSVNTVIQILGDHPGFNSLSKKMQGVIKNIVMKSNPFLDRANALSLIEQLRENLSEVHLNTLSRRIETQANAACVVLKNGKKRPFHLSELLLFLHVVGHYVADSCNVSDRDVLKRFTTSDFSLAAIEQIATDGIQAANARHQQQLSQAGGGGVSSPIVDPPRGGGGGGGSGGSFSPSAHAPHASNDASHQLAAARVGDGRGYHGGRRGGGRGGRGGCGGSPFTINASAVQSSATDVPKDTPILSKDDKLEIARLCMNLDCMSQHGLQSALPVAQQLVAKLQTEIERRQKAEAHRLEAQRLEAQRLKAQRLEAQQHVFRQKGPHRRLRIQKDRTDPRQHETDTGSEAGSAASEQFAELKIAIEAKQRQAEANQRKAEATQRQAEATQRQAEERVRKAEEMLAQMQAQMQAQMLALMSKLTQQQQSPLQLQTGSSPSVASVTPSAPVSTTVEVKCTCEPCDQCEDQCNCQHTEGCPLDEDAESYIGGLFDE